MKIKINQILFFGIVVQIIATQGMLNFYFFNIIGNWELKSLLHPLSLIFIFIFFFIKTFKRITISPLEGPFFLYLFSVFFFLVLNVKTLFSGYLSFREVFLLFILIHIYNKTYLSKRQWNTILKVLHVLIIANIFFVILTYIMHPDEYMRFMTGRFYWGLDPEYKFKITNFGQFWRSPGLVGSSGALAYFGLLTYGLMDREEKYKKKKYLAAFLTIICFTRSAYLVLVLYIVFNFLFQKKNIAKVILLVRYATPIFVLAILYVARYKIFSIESVIMRIDHWINDMNIDYNILFGGAIGKSGGAVRGLGFVDTLDSYWLMMLYSVGIIGIVFMFLFFYEKIKGNKKIIILTISIAIGGIFVTLTQGISFLVLFPLLFLKKDFDDEI